MIKKVFYALTVIAETNLVFFFGVVFGSTIGTLTAAFLLMGFYDASALSRYQAIICGG